MVMTGQECIKMTNATAPGRSYTAKIEFLCDHKAGNKKSVPSLVLQNNCDYLFRWSTGRSYEIIFLKILLKIDSKKALNLIR